MKSIPDRIQIKLCVLGNGCVGKSALTIQYFQNQFVIDWDPTIEDLYTKNDICRLTSRTYQLEVQDTAGQDNYQQMREMYIRESEGFLIVFSLVEEDKSSFEAVKSFYDQIREYHADAPILLVANKQDLDNQRKISEEEILEKAKELFSCGNNQDLQFPFSKNTVFLETSAKTRFNVEEAFSRVIKELMLKKISEEPVDSPGSGPGSGAGLESKSNGQCCHIM